MMIWLLVICKGKLRFHTHWRRNQVCAYPAFSFDSITPEGQLLVDWARENLQRKLSHQQSPAYPWPMPPMAADCQAVKGKALSFALLLT